MPIAPLPSSRRIVYLPSFAGEVMSSDAPQNADAGVRAGVRAAWAFAGGLLVLVVDLPDRFLDQPLDHRVERHAALLGGGDAEHRGAGRADLHLLLGVTLCELLGGFGVH